MKWILTAKVLRPLTKNAIFDQCEDAGARVPDQVLLSENNIAQIWGEDYSIQKLIRLGLNTYILFLWGLTLQIQAQRRQKANLPQKAWFVEHLEHHMAKGMNRWLVYRQLLFWSVFVEDYDSNLSTRIYSNSVETQNDFLCSFLLAASPAHHLKFFWCDPQCQPTEGV